MDSAAMGLVLYYGISEHIVAAWKRFIAFVKEVDEEDN